MRNRIRKLIAYIVLLIFVCCGCTDKATDYEDYFPDSTIEFDNETSSIIDQYDDDYTEVFNIIDIDDDTQIPSSDTNEYEPSDFIDESDNNISSDVVWLPKSGKKYHCRPDCSNMKSPVETTVTDAVKMGYEPCKRCYKEEPAD